MCTKHAWWAAEDTWTVEQAKTRAKKYWNSLGKFCLLTRTRVRKASASPSYIGAGRPDGRFSKLAARCICDAAAYPSRQQDTATPREISTASTLPFLQILPEIPASPTCCHSCRRHRVVLTIAGNKVRTAAVVEEFGYEGNLCTCVIGGIPGTSHCVWNTVVQRLTE